MQTYLYNTNIFFGSIYHHHQSLKHCYKYGVSRFVIIIFVHKNKLQFTTNTTISALKYENQIHLYNNTATTTICPILTPSVAL